MCMDTSHTRLFRLSPWPNSRYLSHILSLKKGYIYRTYSGVDLIDLEHKIIYIILKGNLILYGATKGSWLYRSFNNEVKKHWNFLSELPQSHNITRFSLRAIHAAMWNVVMDQLYYVHIP